MESEVYLEGQLVIAVCVGGEQSERERKREREREREKHV